MEYLGAWWTLIHEKNLKSKISCQTPFNNASRHCFDGTGGDLHDSVYIPSALSSTGKNYPHHWNDMGAGGKGGLLV